MHLIRITAPTKLPVALDEMKLHLRVDHDEDDAMIEGFISAATERLEGRDGLLGCCLINQTWKMTLDRFAPVITLPLPPCQSVTAIIRTALADQSGQSRMEARRARIVQPQPADAGHAGDAGK